VGATLVSPAEEGVTDSQARNRLMVIDELPGRHPYTGHPERSASGAKDLPKEDAPRLWKQACYVILPLGR